MSEETKHARKMRKQLEREKAKVDAINPSLRKRAPLPKGVLLGGLVALALVMIVAFFAFKGDASASKYDSFAQCLKSKGMVVYGNEWCQYTIKQKADFGASFRYLDYRICDEIKPLCKELGLTVTPSFIIGNQTLTGVQTLQTLSSYSGCPLP